MKWNRYTIKTTTAAEDLISSALCDLGIEGVEIENNVPLTDEEQTKMFIDFPPELPEDDGSSLVSFYLDADEDHGELLARVRESIDMLRPFAQIGSGQIEVTQTEDADWINNWKEFFHAFTIPDPCKRTHRDILIKPTWETIPEEDADKIVIEIDPGISFGTGQHETTQLCIRQLMKHVKKNDEVLDLGCGSGILSIAALKLGAGHVTGTDIDEECINSTNSNFEVNHLDGSLGDFYVGNLIDDAALQEKIGAARYDIVVANILADVIIPMAAQVPVHVKEGGVFIASGIIDFKERGVTEAIEAAGLSVSEITRQGEWVCITAGR